MKTTIQLKLVPYFDHAIDIEMYLSFFEDKKVCEPIDINSIILCSVNPKSTIETFKNISLMYNYIFSN